MFLVGLFLTCFSIPSIAWLIYTIVDYYTTPQLIFGTGLNEEKIVMAIGIFILIAIAGISLMIFGWTKKKSDDNLKSIENNETRNFCRYCGVNVTAENNKCPICNRNLKGE